MTFEIVKDPSVINHSQKKLQIKIGQLTNALAWVKATFIFVCIVYFILLHWADNKLIMPRG